MKTEERSDDDRTQFNFKSNMAMHYGPKQKKDTAKNAIESFTVPVLTSGFMVILLYHSAMRKSRKHIGWGKSQNQRLEDKGCDDFG